MSKKVQQFVKNVPYPQNVHNFQVLIPDLLSNGVDVNLIVEATSFPTYKFRTITLWYNGEQIDYPGLPQNASKVWQCTAPETDAGLVYEVLMALYHEMYDEATGVFYPPKYRDIQVFARDTQDNIVFHSILHGSWFEGKEIVNLVNNDPTQVWKWPFSFNFQWIENPKRDAATGSQDPFTK